MARGLFNKTGSVVIERHTRFSTVATVSTRTITIPATTNQDYVVTLTKGSVGTLPTKYSDGTNLSIARRTSATINNVPYGTKCVITYTADVGYTQGFDVEFTIGYDNYIVEHSPAIIQQYTVNIVDNGGVNFTVKKDGVNVQDGNKYDFNSNIDIDYLGTNDGYVNGKVEVYRGDVVIDGIYSVNINQNNDISVIVTKGGNAIADLSVGEVTNGVANFGDNIEITAELSNSVKNGRVEVYHDNILVDTIILKKMTN